MIDERFEWDDEKAASNLVDHHVSFELARKVFDDVNAIDEPDDDPDEERWHKIGMAAEKFLLVVFTERVRYDPSIGGLRSRTRIISARKADNREQERYYRQGQ